MAADGTDRRPSWQRIPLPGGGEVRARIWPGRGRPMVLLHGYMDSSHGWDAYCKATHRPCYALDLPGHGRSSMPAAHTIEAYALAIVSAVQELGLSGACLVGHSMGGAVAAAAADMAPELFDSLVLVAPAGFGRIPMAEFCDRAPVRKVMRATLPLAMANPFLSGLAYATHVSGGKPAHPALSARLMAHALRAGPGAEAGLRALADMSRGGGHSSRRAYPGPVTALWGGSDKLIPAGHAEAMASCYPQARQVTWEDLAHHPQVEQPRRLVALVEHGAARARRTRKEARRARRGLLPGPAPAAA